jgi:hypothetical protein
MSNKSAWLFYLLGAFLTLGWKFIRYVRTEKQHGRPARDAIAEWFFEDSVDNTTSWFTTVSIVWCAGAVLIDLREREGIFQWIAVVPLHIAVAFAFGGLMELAAPSIAKNLVKWIISKMPGA